VVVPVNTLPGHSVSAGSILEGGQPDLLGFGFISQLYACTMAMHTPKTSLDPSRMIRSESGGCIHCCTPILQYLDHVVATLTTLCSSGVFRTE
jgi:hypothetical protein